MEIEKRFHGLRSVDWETQELVEVRASILQREYGRLNGGNGRDLIKIL